VEQALEAEDLRLVLRVEVVQVGGVQQVQPRQLLPWLRQVRLGLRGARYIFRLAKLWRSTDDCRCQSQQAGLWQMKAVANADTWVVLCWRLDSRAEVSGIHYPRCLDRGL
jgi:hypothetical protein